MGSYVGYDFDKSSVFAKVSYGQEFNRDSKFQLNSSQETYRLDGHWLEYQVGAHFEVTDDQRLEFNTTFVDGDKFNQKQLGINYRTIF